MKKKKTKNTEKKKISGAKVVKIGLICMAVLITSVSVFLGVSFFSQTKGGFSRNRVLNLESSTINYASTGQEYHSYGKDGVRKNVTYDQIPQVMIDAVVAAEDSRYFEHNGFDLPRIVKAFMGNVVAGGITGGGSTITQQVMKQSYYPNAENENLIQGVQRKFGEIVLSIQATSQLTKEEVLELYLNKIYFGYGNKAIGIYAASRYYFDKSVENLTLPEAALLAGTLNSPNSFDPFRNLKLAQKRRDTILNLMELHGYITKEECEKTKAIPVQNTLKSNPISGNNQYQDYIDYVTREVIEKTGMDPNEVPMRIYTYMDPKLQNKLNDIRNEDGYKFYDKEIEVGAVVQETKTGRITGILSARDYSPGGSSNAYHKKGVKEGIGAYGNTHQPGSSLKPIIAYAAAFENLDWSTAHYVHDVPLNGSYSPKNHNGKFHGDISIENALSNSWNLAAIQTYIDVQNEIGDDGVQKYLEGFGFDMSSETLSLGYAIGGWSYGTTPKEEAGAYAAIANGGTYIEPHAVDRIELISTGEVIEIDKDINKEKSEAISEESAFMIRDVMTSYVKSAGGYSQLDIGLQIGAKTGTSNWDSNNDKIPAALRGKSKDSWMSAYSPDYAWSVWVGYPEQVAREKNKWLRSGRDSKNISAIIAKTIHDGKVKNSYPSQPSGVVKSTCISGIYPYVKPGSGVPKDRVVTGWFKKGNTPSGSASAAQLNNLESFTATLTNGKINVQFTPYNPESMTETGTPTKTYTANGKSYTLPYLGDIKQIYGKVVYVAEVKDANGNVVHTEKLSKPTATLSYNPGHGNYTVTGYYAFESGDSTSNKIEQTITLEQTAPGASYSVVSQDSVNVVFQVNVPTGSSVTIAGYNTEPIKQTSTVTIPYTPGTTIQFIETTANGKQFNLSPYTMQ